MNAITNLLAALVTALTDRNHLAVENAALRQQILVLQRSVTRARLDDTDRMFWIFLRRFVRGWRDMLYIVQPETVTRWHRNGFRYYWKKRSNATPGRPPIGRDVIALIKRLSTENALWGAPRIQSELALLGHRVAESTVSKYMVRHPRCDSQTWRTFLRNHMTVAAGCDFFVVPTLTFKVLYVFIVLSHDRRRILHVNVTRHPTAKWTAHQILEAFPYDEAPRFLHRDRDSIYGPAFRHRAKALGIDEVISAKQSPWQNPFAERAIGSIRRECTDHIIALGERHLLRTLREYVAYYNQSRTHLSLDRNAPEPRPVEWKGGDVIATPVLNGLHHTYSRAA
jgi:transposase InsO family protein